MHRIVIANINDRFAVDTYSYTLQWPAIDCLRALATRGYREFELQMYPGHLWPAHIDPAGRRALRDFLDANGLSVVTLNMPNIDLNIAAATTDMREMTLGILGRVVELAGDLGVEGVVIGTGKANPLFPMPRSQLVEHFYRGLDRLLPLARDAGTAIYVENMPFAFAPGILDMLDVLTAYGNDGIGVVYDVANGHFMKEDIALALRACAPRLRAVHLSDTDQVAYRHAAVGLGTVDFSILPAALAAVGFARRPILEIIAPSDPDDAIDRSARALLAAGF
ncbi:MAG: sugar phosphate isomerase/epimerase [Betaproteobacteria bacterium]|nr:sugar phosphate isomerase/epimerase [Betaproteobacteria bacterium]